MWTARPRPCVASPCPEQHRLGQAPQPGVAQQPADPRVVLSQPLHVLELAHAGRGLQRGGEWQVQVERLVGPDSATKTRTSLG